MPGVGAFVLIAVAAVVIWLIYRVDRTGGTLTLFVALIFIVILVLALLLAGLVVFASFPKR